MRLRNDIRDMSKNDRLRQIVPKLIGNMAKLTRCLVAAAKSRQPLGQRLSVHRTMIQLSESDFPAAAAIAHRGTHHSEACDHHAPSGWLWNGRGSCLEIVGGRAGRRRQSDVVDEGMITDTRR